MNWKCPFLCSKETRRTCRKTLGARRRINNKLSPHVMTGLGNHTQATVVRGKHSHHCTIPIPLCHLYFPAPFPLPCAISTSLHHSHSHSPVPSLLPCTIPIPNPLCHLYFPAPFLLPCAISSPFKFCVLAKCLIFFYFSPPII